MQARSPLFHRLDLLADRPTVGGLMALCEENYGALRRLAPTLPALAGHLLSRCPGQTDLLLEIIEQAPYTTTLRLTHQFEQPLSDLTTPAPGAPPRRRPNPRPGPIAGPASRFDVGCGWEPGWGPGPAPGSKQATGSGSGTPGTTSHAEPNALLRAYHDARQVEVLDLRQTVLPLFTHYQSPALDAKWRANLFIAKWLGYCLHEGHRFPPASQRARRSATQVLLTSP